jgi:LCP family protein required for cell wall assembly
MGSLPRAGQLASGALGDGVAPRGRRRPRRRAILAAVLVVVLLVVAAGGYLFTQLAGNLHSGPLFGGLTGDAGAEKVDPFGRSPINLLVIGSDSRNNPADCKLGGDCSSGASADVEMVVHIGADRSNATVMSVPRDTVSQLPACRNPAGGSIVAAHVGQINSTLAYGPGCTVAAVHDLTGVPIDHFVMVDFAGVITMSDAVGGASVCVTNNVYDTYSHLKLSKGTHTLKGLAALEFVRSRHGFGDGSDLGRTYAQHIFLSSVVRNLKSAGVLANPTTLYSLANSATKALTVDTGLGSIPNLLGLATDVDKVPTNRITFTTMQTAADPADPNRVVVAPGAQELFATIINDQPLTSVKGSSTPAASPSPSTGSTAVTGLRLAVQVENGSGQAGRAAQVASALRAKGYSRATASTAAATGVTMLRYGSGHQPDAAALAAALGLPSSAVRQGTGTGSGLTLVIGSDWTTGTTFSGAAGAPSPAQTKTALSEAHARTADQAASCAVVSSARTVQLKGVPMSPIQAYARSPQIPDSAP